MIMFLFFDLLVIRNDFICIIKLKDLFNEGGLILINYDLFN